jgi:urease accessory protein
MLMKCPVPRPTLLAVFLSAVPLAAGAHEGGVRAMGFFAGLLHPLGGLDHVLAMLALGAWAAFLGRAAMWRVPLAFVLAMALGGALGLAGVALPAVEAGIAVSVVLLGGLLLLAWRAPLLAGGLIGAIAGLVHGHAHGSALPVGDDALAHCAGFLLCTALLHATGVLLGASLREGAARPLLRSAGAAVAASGLFFVWRALA